MSRQRGFDASTRLPQALPDPGRLQAPAAIFADLHGSDQTEPTPLVDREEAHLLAVLRAGDEGAFSTLIERYHSSMVRLAKTYVRSAADAEEVAQEAWVGVLKGLDRFEQQSSLRTWIFRILTNRAMSWGKRARRTIPFSPLPEPDEGRAEAAVEPGRFLGPTAALPGHWAQPPQRWEEPEERLLSSETVAVVRKAIDALPGAQRRVITLRDIEGWSSLEVCALLDLTEINQRVLLHRARSKVRAALERYMDGGEA